MIIAIDGPAASGKGTIARKLAKHLGYPYLDTGLLYRAVGYKVLESGLSLDNEKAFVEASRHVSKKDLENKKLRDEIISSAASIAGSIPEVRENLLAFQQDFALNPPEEAPGAILDGRDIGTVVCPEADVKFFITASPEIRAERRHKELIIRGINSIYAHVLEDIRIRDAKDSGRKVAPLKPATDAIIIDTSLLDEKQVFEKVLDHLRTSGKMARRTDA